MRTADMIRDLLLARRSQFITMLLAPFMQNCMVQKSNEQGKLGTAKDNMRLIKFVGPDAIQLIALDGSIDIARLPKPTRGLSVNRTANLLLLHDFQSIDAYDKKFEHKFRIDLTFLKSTVFGFDLSQDRSMMCATTGVFRRGMLVGYAHHIVNLEKRVVTTLGESKSFAHKGNPVFVLNDTSVLSGIGGELVLFDLKGNRLKSFGKGSSPAASSDGKWISYSRFDSGLNCINLADNHTQRCFNGRSISEGAKVSPDGSYIVALLQPRFRLPLFTQELAIYSVADSTEEVVLRPWLDSSGGLYNWWTYPNIRV